MVGGVGGGVGWWREFPSAFGIPLGPILNAFRNDG